MQPFAKMWEQRVQGKWFCHGVRYYKSMKGLYKTNIKMVKTLHHQQCVC
jgi:ribosomal protein L20